MTSEQVVDVPAQGLLRTEVARDARLTAAPRAAYVRVPAACQPDHAESADGDDDGPRQIRRDHIEARRPVGYVRGAFRRRGVHLPRRDGAGGAPSRTRDATVRSRAARRG